MCKIGNVYIPHFPIAHCISRYLLRCYKSINKNKILRKKLNIRKINQIIAVNNSIELNKEQGNVGRISNIVINNECYQRYCSFCSHCALVFVRVKKSIKGSTGFDSWNKTSNIES